MSPSSPLDLAAVLGLRPLDRVQLNSAWAIAETNLDARGPSGRQLPYYYFQRVVDGNLELRSPGGCPVSVPPTDVCDVIPSNQVCVMAMPRSVFLERLRLPRQTRQATPSPESYSPAHVLYAFKDRFGRAEAVVWFIDEVLNAGGPFKAPLRDDEFHRFQSLAIRSRMPVCHTSRSAPWSADHGVSRSEAACRRRAQEFILTRCTAVSGTIPANTK
jgi:hypothetical protein